MPEAARENGTSLGEEYFATEPFAYRHRTWDEHVTLTKRPYTMSDLLNTYLGILMFKLRPLP